MVIAVIHNVVPRLIKAQPGLRPGATQAFVVASRQGRPEGRERQVDQSHLQRHVRAIRHFALERVLAKRRVEIKAEHPNVFRVLDLDCR